MGMTNQIAESLKSFEFETKGTVCFGTWKGWCVDLHQWSGNTYFLDVAVRIDPKDKEFRRAIKSALKGFGKQVKFYSATDKKVIFSAIFKKKADPYEQQFNSIMEIITQALRGARINPADTCAICGGGTPGSLCYVDGYQPVHKACIRNIQEKTKDAANQNQENGSYLTGLVGAILGAVIGLIPTLFTIWAFEKIYAILFALIPLLAMWGYTKLNGKKSKFSIAIIVILSFISVFFLQYIVVATIFMDEYRLEFWEAIDTVLQVFANFEGFILIAKESVTEILFMAIGIVFAWKNISNTNAATLKNMEMVMETIHPNPTFEENSENEQE